MNMMRGAIRQQMGSVGTLPVRPDPGNATGNFTFARHGSLRLPIDRDFSPSGRPKMISTTMQNQQSFHDRLKRAAGIIQDTVAQSGISRVPAVCLDLFLRTDTGQRLRAGWSKSADLQQQEHTVSLPAGYPNAAITVRLSVPPLPRVPGLEFSDHVTDEDGRATDTVLATTKNGFAVSRDLGKTWAHAQIKGYETHQFVHVKSIGESEYLIAAMPPNPNPARPDRLALLVADEKGKLLAATDMAGAPWHGCRSVDCSGGVLMYAEYPREIPNATPAERLPSRVFRSHDRGRSWQPVFRRPGERIRHFHFLQARPGKRGEWWLTSGDSPMESEIWTTEDDGATWERITKGHVKHIQLDDGKLYPRTLFRLTDLAWHGDEVVWGTDDYLSSTRKDSPGSRVFRGRRENGLRPRVVGRAGWQIRNLVDIGKYYVFLTQGSNKPNATPEEKRPGVFLMPKTPVPDAPGLVHLFDVEVYSAVRTGFTYSRASRAAKDGTFFSFRAATDAFPFGHKILKWNVSFS
jgi:hypothetical protein